MSRSADLILDLEFTRTFGLYEVQVLRSPVGSGQVSGFSMPDTLIGPGLEKHEFNVFRPDALSAAKEIGLRLFKNAFQGPLLECLRQSLDQARREHARLRIQLRLFRSPGLAALPWELLYDADDESFFALSASTPIVRYFDLSGQSRSLHVALPLNVLVIRSEPADYPQIDFEAEWAQVTAAVSNLSDMGAIRFTTLTSPTLGDLRRALLRGSFHVLHYTGHGAFDEQDGGVLLFADRSGHGFRVTADDLGVLLRDHTSMRLAILNAGEGARIDPSGHAAGVAETLIQQGIPAVVAMQFEITDAAACEFTPALYGALASGLPVDAAVGEARKAIYTTNPVEFATPVLYLRSADGQLFDVAPASPPFSGVATAKTVVPEQRPRSRSRRSARAEPNANHKRNTGQDLDAARPEDEPSGEAASVFVSYAREDERLRKKLSDHLGGLRHGGFIKDWSDGQITPGQEWEPQILRRLDEADIILLLVTSSFLGSEFIGRVELSMALERHRRGEAVVIPVILKPADWQSAGLAGLQALPKGGKAVTSWSDRDAAYLDIAQGVRRAVEAWRARKP
jgi:hypothetical protein